jgi:hypothetical protein
MAASDSLGEQWPRNTELVPVDVLSGMGGNNLRYDVSELSEDLKQHGFKEPGIIRYHQPTRTVRLIEGNHRLAAARQAGMSHMPVRVTRANWSEEGTSVRGIEPNQHGYVPGDLKPSEIMDWE